MPPERPSSPEAIKPSFVEQKAKEVREDLADLLEGSDFSGEVQKLEQRFSEKLDREGFIEAFSHIYLAIVEGRLLGNEERVAYEILDAMRMREENPDPLWLRTLTGQIVAGFMKGLVNEQITKKDQEPDPIFEQLNQVDRSTSEEHRFEIADAFFKPGFHKTQSMLTRMLHAGLLHVQELETKEGKDSQGKTKIIREEFILPWIPIKQIPPLETLQDPKGGYRIAYVEVGYFPQGEPRRREDFELTSKDLDSIKYPKEKQFSFLADLRASHQERFPFCAVFDIKETLEAQKKSLFTSSEALELMTEGKGKRFKYIPASIDHHLAVAAFGWDETETPYVASFGSAFDVDENRRVPNLWRNHGTRRLGLNWLYDVSCGLSRFIVLRKSSS